MKVAAAMILSLALCGTSALAEPTPGLKDLMLAGQIGEQPDGYLAPVGQPSPEVVAVVAKANANRKTYFATRPAIGDTETVGKWSACQAYAKARIGMVYRLPDGSWFRVSNFLVLPPMPAFCPSRNTILSQ